MRDGYVRTPLLLAAEHAQVRLERDREKCAHRKKEGTAPWGVS